MKVGIVTIYDLKNYGNRLQNYAVSEVLKSLGVYSDTLIIDDTPLKRKIKNIIKVYLGKKPNIHWNLQEENKLFTKEYSQLEFERYEKFKSFSHKNINIKYVKLSKNLNEQYDYFIAGSDQVWNTDIGHGLPWEFLTFAEPNKRIGYAPSFGGTEIHNRVDDVSKYLCQMNSISIREFSGVSFIKNISGREAIHLIDPTLMLECSKWRLVEEKPATNLLPEKYILTYFLGNRNEGAEHIIQNLIDTYQLPVIRLRDINNSEIFVSGPSEFLYLIDHASLILTDSFHGSVFSFIFGKPFMVFNREGDLPNMMARVDSFLDMFYLKRKYAGSGLPNDIWEHDYTEGYKQLDIERRKAIDFLKKALED